MNRDETLIITLNKQINDLADSIQNLANITDETLTTTVELTKHITTLQEDFITILNRLNEIELIIEDVPKEPLVKPVIEKRRKNMLIKTPYPKSYSKIRKVVKNLRRMVNAHT